MNRAAQQLGRLGDLSKSEAKTAAVRKNGKLGGRPKKPKRSRRYAAPSCGGLSPYWPAGTSQDVKFDDNEKETLHPFAEQIKSLRNEHGY